MNIALKNKRESNKLSQMHIAKKADISLMSYQRYESGKRIPNVYTAQLIAKALNSSVDELFPLQPTNL